MSFQFQVDRCILMLMASFLYFNIELKDVEIGVKVTLFLQKSSPENNHFQKNYRCCRQNNVKMPTDIHISNYDWICYHHRKCVLILI